MKFHHTALHAPAQPHRQINTSAREWTKKRRLPKAIRFTGLRRVRFIMLGSHSKSIWVGVSHRGPCGELGSCWGLRVPLSPAPPADLSVALRVRREPHWQGWPRLLIRPSTLTLVGLICERYHSGGFLSPEAIWRGQVITKCPSKCSSQSWVLTLGPTPYRSWSGAADYFSDTFKWMKETGTKGADGDPQQTRYSYVSWMRPS